MNRVDRLLAQILLLQAKRVVTAEQMARHFGLNIRTIYRDLAALGEIGVPIVAEVGVGYSLRRGYHLPPVNLTAEEANALVTGGMLVEQLADASVHEGMKSALAKVRAILPRDHQDRLVRLERGLATTAHVEPDKLANLALLQRALSRQQVLRFHYEGAAIRSEIGKENSLLSSQSSCERVVEPMGLIYYLARWHLIAWCRSRQAYRDFRTDRMSSVTIQPETFTPREPFDATDFIRRTMPSPKLKARVRFTRLSADRARREWWLGIVDEEPIDGGSLTTLAAVEWGMLVGWLLSFGTTATVVAPAHLRSLLKKAASEAVEHHSKTTRF